MLSSSTRHRKTLGLIVAAVVAFAAAGCARSPEYKALAGQPVDHDKRHPILLTRSTQSAAIAVGPYAVTITSLQRAAIEGFAQAFRSEGEQSLAIAVPSGAANETNAARLARDIRAILREAGVAQNAIVIRPYRADENVEAPPILLSYTRLTAAVPHACSVSDDVNLSVLNRQWENFGCAAQSNLAALVANPNDLSRPRPLDKASAARRATILEKYRLGEDPKTNVRNPNAGTASNIGQGG